MLRGSMLLLAINFFDFRCLCVLGKSYINLTAGYFFLLLLQRVKLSALLLYISLFCFLQPSVAEGVKLFHPSMFSLVRWRREPAVK